MLFVHRPDVMNALNRETLAEIDHAAARFIEDPAQGALIVTGSGEKSFISGADINELAVLDPRGAEEISRFGQRVVDRLEQSPKPVIAAVNGYCVRRRLRAGARLPHALRFRERGDGAARSEPRHHPGLRRHAAPAAPDRHSGRALELILSGRRVKADEAAALGIVNRVFPREQLLDETVKVAEAMLKNGPLAVAAALEAARRGPSCRCPRACGSKAASSVFWPRATTCTRG